MKNLIFLITTIIGLSIGCGPREKIDTKLLNNYLDSTNILNDTLYSKYKTTLNYMYNLVDDSLKADSISRIVTMSKKVLFYDQLKTDIALLEETFYQAQQEIYFSKDQLKELDSDALENQITRVQYDMQLESEIKAYNLLEQRVDSIINVINQLAVFYLLNSENLDKEEDE